MTSHRKFDHPRKARTLFAALAVVMFLGGAAACSSDSDSTTAGDSSSATQPESGSDNQSKSGSDAELPEGFPDDVPMPDFKKISVLQPPTETSPGSWNVLVTIDPSMTEASESLIEAYTTQLADAGYEVDDSSANVEAENDKWRIYFHSSADGTLAIGTGQK